MARVALPRPEHVTEPAIEGIFAWVTEMEGSVYVNSSARITRHSPDCNATENILSFFLDACLTNGSTHGEWHVANIERVRTRFNRYKADVSRPDFVTLNGIKA